MARSMNTHHRVAIAVPAMIVITMVLLFVAADSYSHANPIVLTAYLILPVMVIVWSILDIGRQTRILGYWGLALSMVPLAALGIFGGYGLLYLIGIIFLLWAAWMENEGR